MDPMNMPGTSPGALKPVHQATGFIYPREALKAIRAQPRDFDIMVTDLSMPHLSGFDLAREVLAGRPGMRLQMTTSYIPAEDEVKAREVGIREHILKPVTMD
jgi:CheY-like chemotaxis protein